MDRERVQANLADVHRRMDEALARVGRPPNDVTLIAVTKGRTVEEARFLYDLGVRHFGENRVQEGLAKIAALPDDVRWHMIGTVQRRKARDVAQYFQQVDSVDRLRLAEVLDWHCAEHGTKMPVLVEVNVSGEVSKHGIRPESLSDELGRMSEFANLNVEGLMTMAPLCDDPEEVRPLFVKLRNLACDNGLHSLSMGMSGDFEVAIEEGATEVRIGSALFVE